MQVTVQDIRLLMLSLSIPTALLTLVRLADRWKKRGKLGVDDAFAALSLAGLILLIITLFLHLSNSSSFSRTTRIALYYILWQGFFLVIWSARLSIIFLIIGISFPSSKFRIILQWFAGSFVLLWLILASQIFWVCEREPGWKEQPAPLCKTGPSVAIAQLISDVYADSVLVIAPVKLVWNMQGSERTRLLIVFSASVVTTISSLVHAYYIVAKGGLEEVLFAMFEACSSLFVCNLAILVSLFSRLSDMIFPKGSSHSDGSDSLTGYGVRWLNVRRTLSTVFRVELSTNQAPSAMRDVESEPKTFSDLNKKTLIPSTSQGTSQNEIKTVILSPAEP